MDGVLADFKTAAVKVNGMSINKWMNIPSSREKWERIKNNSIFAIRVLARPSLDKTDFSLKKDKLIQ